MVTNKVKVRRIIYHSPTNLWGVFTYVNDNTIPELKESEVKVSGVFRDIYAGSEVEITGNLVEHPKYGLQIELSQYNTISNSNKSSIIEFLTKSSISGIDKINACKIYDMFKEDSINVVLNHTDKLSQIKGIATKTIEKVKASVEQYKKQEELLNFCNKIGGIPYEVINKIYEQHGEKAVDILKSNPYALLSVNSSLTFKQVDNIALKMGTATDSDVRLVYGLLYVLYNEAVLRGSTGCGYQELGRIFIKELGLTDSNLYPYTVNVLEKSGKIISESNKIYYTKLYKAEKNISEFLYLCRTNQIYRQYDEAIINEELHNFSFTLNEQQVNAIRSCLKNQFSILTSLAGGGKTTITKALVNILSRHGENVILLSPTGKAAKRLSECTNREAQTIHRFLKVKHNLDEVEPELVPFRTTIIIDESSMVDVLLMEKVIASANRDTRFILVGDTHQLPSVQAGNILEDIIDSKRYNVCVLTDIMRQSESSNIIKYCSKVNNNELFEPMTSKDFVYLNFKEREQLLSNLIKSYKNAVNAYGLQEVQVLCAYKMGSLGMNNLNKVLKEAVNNTKCSDSFNFSVGDKVRHTKNNYKKQVFNGETGVVKDIQLVSDINSNVTTDTLYVDYEDRIIPYTKEDIHELQLSYASTVHAAQGSEYKAVFVVLDNEVSNILLTRKILYTALSRAKKNCLLYSTGTCTYVAIRNNYYRERITKLGDFLVGGDENSDFNFN